MYWLPMHKQPSFALKKRKRQQFSDPAFMDEPSTDRLHGYNSVINGLEIGHSSMQGYRANMEDEFIIDKIGDHTIVAIMDGHAGQYAAIFTKEHLKNTLEETSQWKKYIGLKDAQKLKNVNLISEALVQAYVDLDDLLRKSEVKHESGCTLVCSIITPTHIVCANVGDSRCVIGTSSATIALTEDHKPSLPDEKYRVINAGGFVMMDRVDGELAMSRAIGDFRYKGDEELSNREQKVICYPDIAVHERNAKEDQIMILACDGVWDVVSNEEAVSFVSDVVLKQEEVTTSEEAADMLVDRAFHDGSTDNISVVIVQLNSSESKTSQ